MTDITNKVFTVNVVDGETFHVSVNNEVLYTVELQVPGTATTPIPNDGVAGQVLGKASLTAWDMLWVDVANSVFGRTGAVVAAASDYDASQVDNDSTVGGATVADALNTLGGDSHTHSNKATLDAITAAGSGAIITVSERADLHTHSNKAVLDALTAAGSGAVITTAERSKLAGIEAGAQVNTVASVNGYTGTVVLAAADVGAAPAVHTHSQYLTDAPSDGSEYVRKDGSWAVATGGGGGAVDSVNGYTGTVVLDTDDIAEGTALYFTETRANAASDVVANTAARHTHANQAQLDLVTDGDHDVRTDNPHGVTQAQLVGGIALRIDELDDSVSVATLVQFPNTKLQAGELYSNNELYLNQAVVAETGALVDPVGLRIATFDAGEKKFGWKDEVTDSVAGWDGWYTDERMYVGQGGGGAPAHLFIGPPGGVSGVLHLGNINVSMSNSPYGFQFSAEINVAGDGYFDGAVNADTLIERNPGGIAVQSAMTTEQGLNTDTIAEATTDVGVTVDSVVLKDGSIAMPGPLDIGNTAADPYVRMESPLRGVLRLTNEFGTAFPADSQGAWIELDRETTKWGWNLNAGGGGLASNILYLNNITLTVQDNKDLQWGGQSSASIRFQNPTGTDGGFLTLLTQLAGVAECTGVVAVQNKAGAYTGNTSDPLYDQPHLRVYGGTNSSVNWIESYFDQATGLAHIKTGAGDLHISPEDSLVQINNQLRVDTINEATTAAGVTIEGLLIKDGVAAIEEAIEIVVDGGGATITTGIVVDVVAKCDMTITGWTLLADQSGSIAVGVWKDTYANYPPLVGDLLVTPSITTATKNQATGLSLAVTKGDVLRFNVDSVTSVQRLTVALTGVRA